MRNSVLRSRYAVLVVLVLASIAAAPPCRAYDREVQSLAEQISIKVQLAGKKTVAVVDFTDLESNVTQLGRFLAEEVSVALAEKQKGFEVIDRNRLAAILKEHQLAASGLVDPATVRQLGKIAGVEALALGSVTPMSDQVRVTIKVLDVESAAMIGFGRADIPRIGAIDSLLGNEILEASPAIHAAAAGGGPPQVRPVPQARPLPLTDHKFNFDLQRCELSGQAITCTILIQNMGPDRVLAISLQNTRLYDDRGNDYHPASVSIANSTEGTLYREVEHSLIYQTPVVATLVFRNIVPEAASISQLSIALRERNGEPFPIAFRNLSIEQKVVPSLALAAGGGQPGQTGTSADVLENLVEQQEPLKDSLKRQGKAAVREGAKRGLKMLLDRVLGVPITSPLPPSSPPSPP